MCGIYVHFPFCKRKCLYCAFYSIARPDLIARYVRAVQKEAELQREYLPNIPLTTLYFGGGTPSLVPVDLLQELVQTLRQYFVFAPDWEFTMEANPEQLTEEYLQGLKKIGVNRLSIGVQSLNDDILQFLGRRHSAAQAIASVECAAALGFDNISIDLMYGLSQRTIERWEQEVKQALALPIQHLSAYAISVEPHTLLERKIREGKIPPLEEDKAADEYVSLIQLTREAGFEHYEISNFARDGKVSQHNSNYWKTVPYLGLGASAHSYCIIKRDWNVDDVMLYMRKCNAGEVPHYGEILSLNDCYNEFIFTRLRTKNGLFISEITESFGETYGDKVRKFLQTMPEQFCQRDGDDHFFLTDTGMLFSDRFARKLFE